MTWRYREARFADGDIAVPYEVMTEIATLVQEVNGGIDRDNLRLASVDTDELGAGHAADPKFGQLSATATVSKTANDEGQTWVPIHADLSKSIVCVDGWLEVESSVALTIQASPANPVWVALGIFANDTLVAATDPENVCSVSNGRTYVTMMVTGGLPVPAGHQQVTAVLRFVAHPGTNNASDIDVEFGHVYACNTRR